LVRDRLEALEACSTASGALGLPGIFSSSPGQPYNRPDTRHQQQASQPEDTGKEYCCLPEGEEVEEWFDEDRSARLAVQLVVARANSESDFDVAQPILRQSRLGQALGDAREIARVFVRQDARALVERETRVDLEQLGPRRARVLDAPEMAVAGCEHHAA
jgi:hypothetical protein